MGGWNPLVAQFDALRKSFNSPIQQIGAPQVDAAPAAPKPAAGLAVQGGAVGGQLVDLGGYKVASKVLPHLQQMSSMFPGLKITSGFRDPDHNAAVGGVANSRHLSGEATDWVGSQKDMQNALAWAKNNGAVEALIHDAGSGWHLHVAWS